MPSINRGCRPLEPQRGCLGDVLLPFRLCPCRFCDTAARSVSERAEGSRGLCPRPTILLFSVWQALKASQEGETSGNLPITEITEWNREVTKAGKLSKGGGEELLSVASRRHNWDEWVELEEKQARLQRELAKGIQQKEWAAYRSRIPCHEPCSIQAE